MRKSPQLLALAAVLCTGVTVPALAAWDRIGSVDFTPRDNTDTQYGNFGGRVEALALQARNSDVTCRSVTAVFADGRPAQVFHGLLRRGQNVTVDLPGNSRLIRRLDFNCRSMIRGTASVDIAAEVGRYQAEWRRSPDWDQKWSRAFNWGNNPSGNAPGQGWITVGTERFEGRSDHEMTFAGWGGRNVSTIALRPVNDDARCRNVRVTFNSGERADLKIDNGDFLREDRITTLDLPGNRRAVTRIDMNCHAEHGNAVTMQILTNGADSDRFGNNGSGNNGYVTGQLDTSGWITVGTERFEGRNDREQTFAGWRGRNVDAIAFRPTNDDARCRSVAVTFENGDRVNLEIGNGNILREDRITKIDLPGNRRDVMRIDMNCHAEHGNMVTMQVLASR